MSTKRVLILCVGSIFLSNACLGMSSNKSWEQTLKEQEKRRAKNQKRHARRDRKRKVKRYLFDAVRANRVDIAHEYIRNGADIFALYGREKINLLHVAAQHASTGMVRFLLEQAQQQAKDDEQFNCFVNGRFFDYNVFYCTITPLHLAVINDLAQSGDMSMINVLVAFGAQAMIECDLVAINLFLDQEVMITDNDCRLVTPYELVLEVDKDNDRLLSMLELIEGLERRERRQIVFEQVRAERARQTTLIRKFLQFRAGDFTVQLDEMTRSVKRMKMSTNDIEQALICAKSA